MPSAASELETRLQATGALLTGHFRLSSGLHSDRYFQCARLLQHPAEAEAACRPLAAKIGIAVDVVVGPALGGVIVAHEVARALGTRALFTERQDGEMRLRRGFELASGERVLVVEDVVTTGGSAREAMACIRAHGGEVVGCAALVDRSGGPVDFGVPFHALLTMPVVTHPAENCPLCQQGRAIEKPGSRSSPAPGH